MSRICVAAAVALAAGLVGFSEVEAEPIKLKFAFFSSDRTSLYRMAVKPFVEAVNAEGAGQVQIDVYLTGELGRDPAQQARLVMDGTADLAFVVPGYTPDLFPDVGIIAMPGLYADMAEATFTYTGLVAQHALDGHERFFTIGAFAGPPEVIHTREAVESLATLQGMRIRVNNPMEAEILTAFEALPVHLPINRTVAALAADEIDGSMLSMSEAMIEFGISRMTTNHYLLETTPVPLAVVMNRSTFEGLPAAVQDIVRKHSGDWAARQYVQHSAASTQKVLEGFRADPKRRVVEPSPADLERARAVFAAVTERWVEQEPSHRELFEKAKSELAKIR